MPGRKYVTETLSALSRQGVRGLVGVMLVIAGISLGSQGFATAAAVLLAGLGCGMAVLIIMARASLDPGSK
ncbi:hypothetical protein G6027_08975 [Dietzia sp. SLG310A2-38A2]|uniref:hypothetical protein n=1 Tax=Dietzia sp. SLG310A2-38A2 TaxID=1630643 RepID=UPI0015FC2DB7|nr:hypothetical protein [Dietzia sp. SLG310A2-38A2]MBB1031016.1 hypothetical protein [Dietzia sp. SLG310A2-38A2]